MQRIPEPELMNDPQQARAYAYADFEAPHQSFIDLFQEKFPGLQPDGAVLDLGCGPCDISRRFALAYPGCTVHAVDGAEQMLTLALTLNEQQGLAGRIQLIHGSLPGVTLPQRFYPTIISNSLLHHLHNPLVLWETIQQHAEPGANVFIMDLMRPASKQAAQSLVEQYARDEEEILQRDFHHSLLAAFTPEEVRQQLDQLGMGQLDIEVVSDRHMIIYGSMN